MSGEGCGSVAEVRDEVRTRLGRDPDAEPGNARFLIEISRRGGALEARLTTSTAAGTSTRTFSSSDCRELLGSVGLAIAITLDPALLLDSTPTPTPAPTATPAPAPPPTTTPPPPLAPLASPPIATRVSLALLGAGSAGISGPVTASGGVSLGLTRGPWWLAVEGRIDALVLFPSPLGNISVFATKGTLAPGWQTRWLRVSVPVSLGALLVEGGGSSPVRDSRLLVLAGVEATFRWSLTTWFSLEPFLRAQVVATRISVLAGKQTVWLTWPFSLEAGLALRFDFPLSR